MSSLRKMHWAEHRGLYKIPIKTYADWSIESELWFLLCLNTVFMDTVRPVEFYTVWIKTCPRRAQLVNYCLHRWHSVVQWSYKKKKHFEVREQYYYVDCYIIIKVKRVKLSLTQLGTSKIKDFKNCILWNWYKTKSNVQVKMKQELLWILAGNELNSVNQGWLYCIRKHNCSLVKPNIWDDFQQDFTIPLFSCL